MTKYLEIAKITFKTQLIWRFDILTNIIFTAVKILLAYILWSAIFQGQKVVEGFTFRSMLSYYIISSFLSQIDKSDSIGWEISSRIRAGTFSKYMVLPVNTECCFLFQTIGTSVFYLIFNLLAALIWIVIFHIHFIITTNILIILSVFGILLLGLIFMIQLNFLLGILTFHFQDISLFLMIKNNLIAFITGTMLPLILLPEKLVLVMRYLPFYHITYLPSMLLIGRNQSEIIPSYLTLIIWVLSFAVINYVTYNRLRVKYDGVGI